MTDDESRELQHTVEATEKHVDELVKDVEKLKRENEALRGFVKETVGLLHALYETAATVPVESVHVAKASGSAKMEALKKRTDQL